MLPSIVQALPAGMDWRLGERTYRCTKRSLRSDPLIPWQALAAILHLMFLILLKFNYLLHWVVKYAFGLPCTLTFRPSGGNGIVHTQTF
jgi:hypothetical protein